MTPKYLPFIATIAAVLSCTASIFAISSRLRAEPTVQNVPTSPAALLTSAGSVGSAASVASHPSAPAIAQAASSAIVRPTPPAVPDANAPLPVTDLTAKVASTTANPATVSTPVVKVKMSGVASTAHAQVDRSMPELATRSAMVTPTKTPEANDLTLDPSDPQSTQPVHDRLETRERLKQRLQEMTPQERQELRSRLRSR